MCRALNGEVWIESIEPAYDVGLALSSPVLLIHSILQSLTELLYAIYYAPSGDFMVVQEKSP